MFLCMLAFADNNIQWLHLVNIMVYTNERVEVTYSRNYTILMQENTGYNL